jgi:hypothetical protein
MLLLEVLHCAPFMDRKLQNSTLNKSSGISTVTSPEKNIFELVTHPIEVIK